MAPSILSKIPVIKWDGSKCLTPLLCKKCLQICPTAVFRSGRYGTTYERGKEYSPSDPGHYKILPEWIDLCIGCMKCVEQCPEDAIEIEYPVRYMAE